MFIVRTKSSLHSPLAGVVNSIIMGLIAFTAKKFCTINCLGNLFKYNTRIKSNISDFHICKQKLNSKKSSKLFPIYLFGIYHLFSNKVSLHSITTAESSFESRRMKQKKMLNVVSSFRTHQILMLCFASAISVALLSQSDAFWMKSSQVSFSFTKLF